jgi:DNA polymerase III sliding clamp (beta) subunit (PCNA family)
MKFDSINMAAALFAANKKSNRFLLKTLHFCKEGTVGTDGAAMAVVPPVPEDEPAPLPTDQPTINIPPDELKEFKGTMEIVEANCQTAKVRAGFTEKTVRLEEGHYPNYRACMPPPEADALEIAINPEILGKIAKLAKAAGSDQVRFKFQKEKASWAWIRTCDGRDIEIIFMPTRVK